MSRLITDLVPELQPLATEFVMEARRRGVPVLITRTLSTYAEQNALYSQGRTVTGKIVTKARGGFSWHNFGRAFDVVPVSSDGKICLWNARQVTWNILGEIGTELGLEWGGSWKGFVDLPHFQLTGGRDLAELRAEHEKVNA